MNKQSGTHKLLYKNGFSYDSYLMRHNLPYGIIKLTVIVKLSLALFEYHIILFECYGVADSLSVFFPLPGILRDIKGLVIEVLW